MNELFKIFGTVGLDAKAAISGLKDVVDGAKETEKSLEGVIKSVGELGGELKKAGDIMQGAGKTATKFLTVPFAAASVGVIKVGKDFEASMSSVQAISGATGEELERLTERAREMGAATRYSASEAADALGFMALAGWDTTQMIDALPGVLSLATTGQLELAEASDILTDIMSMFNIEAGEATKATDIFASAQANSNLSVNQLSESLINVGPTAAALGVELEQISAALGILANNGLKGGKAGTTLDAVFRDLQESAEDGSVQIGETSVAIYDASGQFRGLGAILKEVEQATSSLSDEQKRNALGGTFTQQSLRGINILLGAGADSLNELEGSLYNSSGAAQEMADIMDDNLSGSFAELSSSLEEVALSFYDITAGPIKAFVDGLTWVITQFGKLPSVVKQVIVIVGGLLALTGPILMFFGAIASGIGNIMFILPALPGAITAVTASLGLLQVALIPILAAIAPFVVGAAKIVAGIVAVIAIVKAVIWVFENFGEAIWGFTKDAFGAVVEFLKEIANPIRLVPDLFKMMIEKIAGYFGFEFEWPDLMGNLRENWEKTKNFFTGIVDWVKGLFGFDVDGPGLSGGGGSSGGDPNIAWNAKGGIFKKPTIFNTRAGLQGVGEADPEAIIPLNEASFNEIAKGIVNNTPNNQGGDSELLNEQKLGNELTREMIIRLDRLERAFNVSIDVDGREFAAAVGPDIDKYLGQQARRRG